MPLGPLLRSDHDIGTSPQSASEDGVIIEEENYWDRRIVGEYEPDDEESERITDEALLFLTELTDSAKRVLLAEHWEWAIDRHRQRDQIVESQRTDQSPHVDRE